MFQYIMESIDQGSHQLLIMPISELINKQKYSPGDVVQKCLRLTRSHHVNQFTRKIYLVVHIQSVILERFDIFMTLRCDLKRSVIKNVCHTFDIWTVSLQCKLSVWHRKKIFVNAKGLRLNFLYTDECIDFDYIYGPKGRTLTFVWKSIQYFGEGTALALYNVESSVKDV